MPTADESPLLPDETLQISERLRRTVRQARPGPGIGPELDAAVREFARAARARGVLPERAVIVLKELLGPVPAPQERYFRDHEALCSRVVRACIDEYFVGTRDGRGGAEQREAHL